MIVYHHPEIPTLSGIYVSDGGFLIFFESNGSTFQSSDSTIPHGTKIAKGTIKITIASLLMEIFVHTRNSPICAFAFS